MGDTKGRAISAALAPAGDLTLGRFCEELYALALAGGHDAALRLIDEVRGAGPSAESIEGLLLARSRVLVHRGRPGDLQSAVSQLEPLVAKDGPTGWRASLELARVALRAGRAADGALALRSAVEQFRRCEVDGSAGSSWLARVVAAEVESLSGESRRTHEANLDPQLLLRLIDVGRRLAAETDPDRVLGLVLHEAMDLTAAERGFVVRTAADRLEYALARNLDRSEVDDPAFEISRTLLRDVIRTGSPTFLKVEDLPRDDPAGRSLADRGVRAVACVPILGPAGALGALYLDRRSSTGDLGGSQPALLELFAGLAGAALVNAQSHRDKARALEAAGELLERHRAERERRTRYERLVGSSLPMQEVYRRLDRIVPTEMPVVISGETGTGKELVARLIHGRGPRAGRELVTVNCAGIAETLLESELFGHERGAFTGADRARPGLFEMAHRGTLFLDEVGDMSPRMQGELLRVVQSGELRRVGGRETIHVDVRLICATHRDLYAKVRRGEFREDLFYRLNVLTLDLPALRERPEDVPLLAIELLAGLAPESTPQLSVGALRGLAAYPWPGNVRELENVLRRLVVLGVPVIEERHVLAEQTARDPRRSGILREVEAEAIRRALDEAGGNRAAAARRLGVDRKTLRLKLRRLEP